MSTEQASVMSIYTVSIKHGLRTIDYRLDVKHGLRYKTRTKHNGLGIKHGIGYKT